MSRRTKKIGLVGAIAIGIGGMVGGGIFAVLGEAVAQAHGATPVAFLVAGAVALLTSFSYAHLAVTYQDRGGTVSFLDKAFGNNLASGSVNLLLWLSYLVTIALYGTAFASYAGTFFSGHGSALQRHLLITVAIILPTVMNLVSAAFVARSETMIVALKVILLMVIIIFSVPHVRLDSVGPTHWGSTISIVSAGMMIFVAYEGFELIANAAEDIKEPQRNLPLAFFSSVLLVIALYVVIALVTVSTVPEAQLLTAKDYALAVAAEPALGRTGFVIVAVAALLATLSAINATVYGNARLGYTLAKDGELPEELEKEVWNKPVMGILITAGISLLIANTIDLTEIAILGSASFLLIFTLINGGAFKLRATIGGSPWIYALATLCSATALIVLLVQTALHNIGALVVFLAFLGISVLFEATYGRVMRGHFLGRSYRQK